MHKVYGSLALGALALALGCSDAGDDTAATGGGAGTGGTGVGGAGVGGSTSGGTGNQSGAGQSGSGVGGTAGTGGSAGAGLSQGGSAGSVGGAGSAGTSAGTAGTAGTSAGTAGLGGSGGSGGAGAGGVAGSAAGLGGGGAGGKGGAGAGGAGGGGKGGMAGASGAGAGGAGGTAGSGGSGSFDPCPAGESCKVLPLGDSITWGISYGGGYRIKLFIHANNDMKKITFVGYDTANPPSSSVLSGLGSAMANWKPNHEGHSGWTIQQDDELVLGTSKQNNDGVNYNGKKVVADLMPHIVLVHLGTNDFRGDIAGAPARLGTLIDHVVADAPNALVVVASVIPYPGGGSAVMTFNNAIPPQVKTRADAGKHVIFVDMFAGLTSSDLSDGVHPNEGGYEKMAVVWYNAIKQYLK